MVRWLHAPDPRVEKFFDAVERGDAERVELMLKDARGLALTAAGSRKSGPEPVTMSGETPLHAAARRAGEDKSHYEICRLLIEYGADVNAVRITRTPEKMCGSTPLLELLYEGGISTGTGLRVLELLLENGADVNFRDCRGRSALDIAMEFRAYGEPGAEVFHNRAVELLEEYSGR